MIISFSHNDLDALGCELCIKEKFKNSEVLYFNTNYKNIKQKTIDVIKSIHKCTGLFITDICFNEHTDLLLKITKAADIYDVPVFYIDHHEYDSGFFDINFKFKYFKIDKTKCAAVLTSEFLKSPEDLKLLCRKIQSFDIWQEDSEYFKEGVDLNTYYWIKFNDYNFTPNKFHRFFYPELYSDFNDLIELKNKEFKEFLSQNKHLINIKDDIAVAIIDDFYIPLQLELFSRGVKVFIIITTYGKVMIRLDKSLTNKAKEIKSIFLEEQRGHLLAFSVDAKFNNMNEVNEFIKKYIPDVEAILKQ